MAATDASCDRRSRKFVETSTEFDNLSHTDIEVPSTERDPASVEVIFREKSLLMVLYIVEKVYPKVESSFEVSMRPYFLPSPRKRTSIFGTMSILYE